MRSTDGTCKVRCGGGRSSQNLDIKANGYSGVHGILAVPMSWVTGKVDMLTTKKLPRSAHLYGTNSARATGCRC